MNKNIAQWKLNLKTWAHSYNSTEFHLRRKTNKAVSKPKNINKEFLNVKLKSPLMHGFLIGAWALKWDYGNPQSAYKITCTFLGRVSIAFIRFSKKSVT